MRQRGICGMRKIIPTAETDEGLRRAREAAGSLTRLAIGLGINPASVSRWVNVPEERCAQIESKFGVPRAVLRPDLFS